MDAQQVFDTVVNHLRQQNAKAQKMLDSDNRVLRCMYRSPDGLKCAVGCLITDQEYDDHFEKVGDVQDLLDEWSLPISLFERLNPHRILLVTLQKIHDNLDIEDWEDGLERAARDHELVYTAP